MTKKELEGLLRGGGPTKKSPELLIAVRRAGGGLQITVDDKEYQPDVADVVFAKIEAAIRRKFLR